MGQGTDRHEILDQKPADFQLSAGGVSNVNIDGNNALQIKAIGVVISNFETLPRSVMEHAANETIVP